MLVTTRNNDNTETVYIFAPEHKSEVIKFYSDAYRNLIIQGFRATLPDGSILNLGAN